ncbi:3-oxoacyl-[acyl-carrier protein] reductase [Rhizobium azooxidifex]|uniref:3-oxoacyl-[acyl-carrier protein] reductase n=1 Tax=Mycoplana azooxidifex TaxID=1636188 RepID=A0A7W6D811_9HYPH|nr:3-oxoacyl-ACP reductase family protein [Mycoplana azooxidifex]MBB3978430.1 3-oxoacyl-[acyl-carrier protein] reductase [Mycoplana azooxidifex]
MENRDQSRTALVFGGSRGIGGAIAQRLAADGFQVALTYVSRPERAAEVVSTIEAMGGRALAIRADSAEPEEIRAAVDRTVAEFGSLDVAVVNAGVLKMAALADFTIEDLDLSLNVNVRGVYLAIQAAARQMRDGGRIITIGSNTASRTGSPAGTVYAMTKAAVAAMTRGIALDLAPRRITVNNIQPGPTETDMTADMITALKDVIPLKRVGQPKEIASLASYLASAEAGYMTGASLTMDGGYIL